MNEEYEYFTKLVWKYNGKIESNVAVIIVLMYMKFNKRFSTEDIREATTRFDTTLTKFIEFIFEDE